MRTSHSKSPSAVESNTCAALAPTGGRGVGGGVHGTFVPLQPATIGAEP
jgi:hypothetical protein